VNGSPSPYAPHWPTGTPGGSLAERAALIAIAAVFCGALAVWLTGGLAGAVFGTGWPVVPVGEMGGVLVRLPSHFGNPRAAWPAPARTGLPGPGGFYLILAALSAALICAGLMAVRAVGVVRDLAPGPARGGSGRGAAWARRGELRGLLVRGPVAGRLTLGRIAGRLVAAEARQSAIVIAPTQSLKTTGLAIPAILEWDGPVLAASVKTDLLRDTLARRQHLGAVTIYDPTQTTALPDAGWTPLSGCGTWQGAQRTAAWLCAAAQPGRSSLSDADFWYSAAAKLLAPVLLAAAATKASMGEVVRWIDTQEQDEVKDGLLMAGVEEALIAAEASWRRDERQRSSIYTTTETVLQAYADPGVLASAQHPELTPEQLLNGNANTAFLCAPAHEQQRLRPLFATLIQQIIAAVYERAARTGKPLDPPLLLVLDEAANIAPLRDLDTLASTAAGQGIQLLTVFQDFAQIKERWGERAATILNNHRAKIIGSGIADPATLDYAARVLGDEEIRQTSSTAGHEGHASTTESTAYRTLAPAHALRQARAGSGVLIYGNLPPARIQLRPWFTDRRLRALSGQTPERSR